MPQKKRREIDELVGRNIRLHRLQQKMSQEMLAKSLGLTFQQVQKYEKGTNRVGASRLHDIARVFKVPVAAFFEGSDDDSGSASPFLRLLAEPYALRTVQALSKVTNNDLRRSLAELLEQIIAAEPPRAAVKRPPATTRRRDMR